MKKLFVCNKSLIRKKEIPYEIREIKPGLFKGYPGQKLDLKKIAENIYWYLLTAGKYRVWVAYEGEKAIHYTYVVPKCSKFPFIPSDGYEIGPVVTEAEYRGKGILPAVLYSIVSKYNKDAYSFIEETNNSSVKGFLKSGFILVSGEIIKKPFKKYAYSCENIDEYWKYYKFAVIPKCQPHQEAFTLPIKNKYIWNFKGKKPLLARWTSDFDCKEETNWWYCIKDDAYDLSSVKAKRRYIITSARKFFEIKEINSFEYSEQLYQVQRQALKAYPAKYRPKLDKDIFIKKMKDRKLKLLGAFMREDAPAEEFRGRLCGYAYAEEKEDCIIFSTLKSIPSCEKYQINAALVDGFLEYYKEYLETEGKYICDGERNIRHETAFQKYLEKYFGFRKAYCTLNISYRPGFGGIVKILYPFKEIFKKLDKINLFHMINGILEMEYLRKNRQDKD